MIEGAGGCRVIIFVAKASKEANEGPLVPARAIQMLKSTMEMGTSECRSRYEMEDFTLGMRLPFWENI